TDVRKVAASPNDDFVAVAVTALESALEVFRLSDPGIRTTLIAKVAPRVAPAFSPDGHFLMALDSTRAAIQLWKMPDIQPSGTISTLPNTFAFAIDPGSEIIASGGRDAKIELWSRAQNRR